MSTTLPLVRVTLPYALQTLARCDEEVTIAVTAPVTAQSVVAALEARFPQLTGAILEHGTGRRRPMIRFFACQQDISHAPLTTALPAAVADGREPFMIVGAIAGG